MLPNARPETSLSRNYHPERKKKKTTGDNEAEMERSKALSESAVLLSGHGIAFNALSINRRIKELVDR